MEISPVALPSDAGQRTQTMPETWLPRSALPLPAQAALLAAGYAALAYLGSLLYVADSPATYLWPANALVLAVLCRTPPKHWPLLLAAAGLAECAVDLWFAMPWWAAAGLALANVSECVVAALLARRFGVPPLPLDSLHGLLRFIVVVALAPLVSACIGPAVLYSAGLAPSYLAAWRFWWVSDAAGLLLLTPALLALLGPHSNGLLRALAPARWLELALLLVSLAAVASVAFGTIGQTLALRSMVFPFLVWAALRFGVPGAAWALVVVAGVAVRSDMLGASAFTVADHGGLMHALAVQAFLAIAGLTTLTLAAALGELRSATARFRRVVEAAPNGMLMIDGGGRIVLANTQAQRMFGYAAGELLGRAADTLLPSALLGRHTPLRAGFAGETLDPPLGVGRDSHAVRKDGSLLAVEISLNPIETPEGPMVLAAVVDISARKRDEERLRTAYQEKEVLLKEVYHRVKNNLQIVSALISLQARHVPEQSAREALARGEARIRSMALVHEQLYQAHNLATLDVANYLATLVGYLNSQSGEALSMRVQCEAVALGMDQAIPCGLIVTELVTNAARHAFPDGCRGEISVRLRQEDDGWLALEVNDNGIGLTEGSELAQHGSLGWVLVQSLAKQLGGSISVRRGGGTSVLLRFPSPGKQAVVA